MSTLKKSFENVPFLFGGHRVFWPCSKMLTDVMIKHGFIPVEKRQECLLASSRVLTANPDKSMALLGDDEVARKDVFLHFSKEIRKELR